MAFPCPPHIRPNMVIRSVFCRPICWTWGFKRWSTYQWVTSRRPLLTVWLRPQRCERGTLTCRETVLTCCLASIRSIRSPCLLTEHANICKWARNKTYSWGWWECHYVCRYLVMKQSTAHTETLTCWWYKMKVKSSPKQEGLILWVPNICSQFFTVSTIVIVVWVRSGTENKTKPQQIRSNHIHGSKPSRGKGGKSMFYFSFSYFCNLDELPL